MTIGGLQHLVDTYNIDKDTQVYVNVDGELIEISEWVDDCTNSRVILHINKPIK